MPAELGGAERARGDAVARIIKTGKRTLEPADAGETISFGHTHVVHDDLAGGRRAQAELAFDLGRGQTLHAALENETGDRVACTFVELCPNDHDVSKGRVADPHLAALEHVAAVDLA